ncbi:MAG: hypothetical protein GY869_00640, partial [Planctomycetes bacterium]|nr:hypothetical protein [Planctomycetota bacterium]
ATTLNNGDQVFFVGGDDADFELGDTWTFEAVAIYSAANMVDLDRNSVFRSGATFNTVFDLGSAQNVKALILQDHNLTAATSTLTLQGHTADSWGSPSYSQALTITDPLIFYPDETYRYWRLVPVDATLEYVEIGECYLGDYLELTHNAQWETPRTYSYKTILNANEAGIIRRKAYAKQEKLTLSYPLISEADITNLLTMQETLIDLDTGIINPLFLHLFYDVTTDGVWLMDWSNIDSFGKNFKFVSYASTALEFTEQVKTRF